MIINITLRCILNYVVNNNGLGYILDIDQWEVKKLYKEDTDSYLKWIGSLANADNCDENLFLSVFKINDDINEKLLELVEKITRR